MTTTAKHRIKNDFSCRLSKKDGGYLHAEGQYLYNGCIFKYSFNEQKYGHYRMRGRISAISVRDGSVLQIKGKRRREITNRLKKQGKEPSSETFSMLRQINLNSTAQEDIEAAVKKAAERLYADNSLIILDDSRDISINEMRPSQAARIHCSRFLETESGNADTRRRKERELMEIAAKLDTYTMDAIPQAALSSIYKDLPGKTRGTTFRLMERFWRYCLDIGVYHGQNSFECFLMKNPAGKKVAPEELQRRALQPASLPEKVERAINQDLQNASPDNTKMTGLLLIKSAGFSSSDACKLRWDDVEFNQMGRSETTVQFAIKKNFSAGATHDYKRPGTPICARELHRRAEFFRAQWGILAGHYVLEDLTGKRLESKVLTAFCREELLRCGMAPSVLAPDRTEPHGIGVRLLLSNYKNFISYRSGFQQDSGVINFLQGYSLAGNVTADNYRSFTSPEAQDFLLDVLSRDKTLESPLPAGGELITENHTAGITKIQVLAEKPQRFNHVTFTVRLEPEQTLEIWAQGLIRGSVKAKRR